MSGNDTSFSPTALGGLRMGGSAQNTLLVGDEGVKQNFPPLKPAYERPTRAPAMLRRQSVGTRHRKVPEYV